MLFLLRDLRELFDVQSCIGVAHSACQYPVAELWASHDISAPALVVWMMMLPLGTRPTAPPWLLLRSSAELGPGLTRC